MATLNGVESLYILSKDGHPKLSKHYALRVQVYAKDECQIVHLLADRRNVTTGKGVLCKRDVCF
jgi:hypothetical protein